MKAATILQTRLVIKKYLDVRGCRIKQLRMIGDGPTKVLFRAIMFNIVTREEIVGVSYKGFNSALLHVLLQLKRKEK